VEPPRPILADDGPRHRGPSRRLEVGVPRILVTLPS
jgi:hypothetical protein